MEIPLSPPMPEASHRSERIAKESASPKVEDKTTQGFYIPEAERLIKIGLYKKAFNLMEKHMLEAENIPTILRIRLCRRVMACLTKICTGYLMKGEIHHIDRFVKLLEKSNNFLFLWHELLRTYVTKTNPKFAHLRGLLDDMSEASDEELEAMNLSKSRKSSQYIQGSFESVGDTGDQKASMFTKKLKKQKDQTSRDRELDYIENTFNFLGGPSVKVEEFDGTEINVSFFLDDFLKYLLCVILNWSLFFKKVMKKYQAAYRFLTFCDRISKEAEASLNPDLLNMVARVKLTNGVFNSEFGRNTEAMTIFESTINILQVEVSLRINRNKEKLSPTLFMAKLRKTIRLLIFVFINMSTIYEHQDNYHRILESLKLGCWFATKFLLQTDEAYKTVASLYDNAMRKYDKYLKELGEIERIANGNNNDVVEHENRSGPSTADHFTKINEHLYKKFHYDQLNAGQFVVLISTPPKNVRATKNPYRRDPNFDLGSDDYMEHNDKGSERSNHKLTSPMKSDWYGDASMTKSTNEHDSQHGRTSLKLNSSPSKSINLKEKRRRKYKKPLNISTEEVHNKIMSERYRQSDNPEKEIDQMDIDNEEENKYIAMLNKNIKRAQPTQSKRSTTFDPRKPESEQFVDIDGYFKKALESEIKEREQELKIHPTEFKRIVKNYAYFLQNEEFDKKELNFANKALAAKAREDLGDTIIPTKYKSPTFKIAQLNGVKMEAYYYEVKMEAENRIVQRNNNLKTAKHMYNKSLKIPSRHDIKDQKLLIQETPNAKQAVIKNSKLNSMTSRRQKSFQFDKGATLDSSTPHLTMTGGMMPKSALNRGSITSDIRLSMLGSDGFYDNTSPGNYSQKAKDAIQLMMESIEKNIEEEDGIKKRIEDNRPLVEYTKPKEKFLKIPGELAKSTSLLSEKRDAKQKAWNLSDLVKGSTRPEGTKPVK